MHTPSKAETRLGARSHTVTHTDGHKCNTHTAHTCADRNSPPSDAQTQGCIHTIDRNSEAQVCPPPTKRVITIICIDRCTQPKSSPHTPHQSPVSTPSGHAPWVELGMKHQTALLQKAQSGTRSEVGMLGCISHHSSLSSSANGIELQILSLSWESLFKARQAEQPNPSSSSLCSGEQVTG